jgi:SAM-dependent methyltransferase
MSKFFCPLCGHQEARLVTKEGEWDIVECFGCAFVFITPVPNEQFLHLHYQKYLPADEVSIAQWRVMMVEIFQRSLNVIESKSNYKRGALLDIGCGYGFFLEKARQKGWRVFGIEPCDHARAYAKSRALAVEAGNLFYQKYVDETFDVVTLFYVLEHLPEPLRYLKEIYRILKPGGVLLVRVPHTTPIVKILKSFGIRNRLYDVPSHLSDFSPRTMAMVLEKTGFNDIHTFPGGATRPHPLVERMISCSSGLLADFLYIISGKRLLVPGVSKTTIARKRKHSVR